MRVEVLGLVQGVGFRTSAKRRGDQLGLHGWVRNRGDGSVEAVVEGEENAVEDFVVWCGRGPVSARVEEVRVHREEYTGELRDFRVTH